MNVAFRVDASRQIGSGHVMRCLTLADALTTHGARCLFISREHEGALFAPVRERGHSLVALPVVESKGGSLNEIRLAHDAWLGADWRQDAAETREALGAVSFDWLIVDHYALDARWERALRPACNSLMAIDDLADRTHDCDLLLDQNLGRSATDYAALVPKSTLVLTGPRYALLRPEFGSLRAESLARRTDPELRNILVTMGGVDPDNVTERVLEALEESALPELVSVTVVMGSGAPWLESVRARAARARRRISVHSDVKNMARLMTDCDLAIGAAGSTSWERCCLGAPSIVIVLAENQAGIATALAAHGAALYGGDKEQGPVVAAQAALRLSQDKAALKSLGKTGSSICDGEGARRISEELIRMTADHESSGFLKTLTLRRVGEADRTVLLSWRNDADARRNSRQTAVVSEGEHNRWFAHSLTNPNRIMLMGEMNGEVCGTIRFDLDDVNSDLWRVSIVINPVFRGKGLGRALLDRGCTEMEAIETPRAFIAEIRLDNHASRRIFERCGFVLVSEKGAFMELRREASSRHAGDGPSE